MKSKPAPLALPQCIACPSLTALRGKAGSIAACGLSGLIHGLSIGTMLMIFPLSAFASPLPKTSFDEFASSCAPEAAVSTLRAVAAVESNFEPWAVRDNTTHEAWKPPTLAAAIALAKTRLRKSHSVDLGIMQINSENLAALGMTIDDALDPCRSLKAGARILSDAYAKGETAADRQAAVLIALSRYNTGRALDGLANGYVGQVLSASSDPAKSISGRSHLVNSEKADWNVWAVASQAKRDGADWLICSQDTHDFLLGAGAQPIAGEPHALFRGPETAPGT